jgi:hypothetical protein
VARVRTISHFFLTTQAPVSIGAYVDIFSEIAQCFGSDVSKIAIQNQFWGWVNPNVKAMQAARASGKDCKDLALRLSTGGSGKSQKTLHHSFIISRTHNRLLLVSRY